MALQLLFYALASMNVPQTQVVPTAIAGLPRVAHMMRASGTKGHKQC
jgi:hypothetical protein